jgi:hypothetical protein
MESKPNQDFLKYWRVVRYYIKAKYDLTACDLDMLLFLYSEKYFNQTDFEEYEEIMTWDRDRMKRLREKGWIIVFRRRTRKSGAVYALSHKARGVIKSIYQKLLGAIDFSTDVRRTPLGMDEIKYTSKVYRNTMKKINEEYKQLRREQRGL